MKRFLTVLFGFAVSAVVSFGTAQADSRGISPNLHSSDVIVGNIVDHRIVDTYQSTAIVVMTKPVGKKTGYASFGDAKAAAAKLKGIEVILRNASAPKATMFSLASVVVVKATAENLASAQKNPHKLMNDSAIALDFKAMLLNPDIELFFPTDPVQNKMSVADIANDQCLLIGSVQMQGTGSKGSKFWRQTLDAQLQKERLNEAKAIYLEFEAMNTASNSNDLPVAKIARETNLKKLYRSGEALRGFVESEMTRWNYTDAQKANVRNISAKP